LALTPRVNQKRPLSLLCSVYFLLLYFLLLYFLLLYFLLLYFLLLYFLLLYCLLLYFLSSVTPPSESVRYTGYPRNSPLRDGSRLAHQTDT
jgi:hypothetical protein